MELADISVRLKEARERRSVTLKDVSETTHIRTHYLKAIEDGDWEQLRDVYAVGYIREYARFLEIDDVDTLAKHFNERFSRTSDMPLVEHYPSKNKARTAVKQRVSAPSGLRKPSRRRGGDRRIPALLTVAAVGVAIYALSFSSTKHNETEGLRDTFNGINAETYNTPAETPEPASQAARSKEKSGKDVDRVPVAFSPDALRMTPETNYVLHSEASTTVRIYDNTHNQTHQVNLLPGDVIFVAVPEGGYASATQNPESVIVYSEDMQENFGDIRSLLPKQ